MIPLVPPTMAEIRAGFDAAQGLSGSWGAVLERFAWIDVELSLRLDAGFHARMEMMVALRGAIGRVLREAELPLEDAAAQDQPGAARLMFRDMGKMAKGMEYPKPFLLQFDDGAGVVRVRLFGPLMCCAAEIASALVRVATQAQDNPLGCVPTALGRKILPGRIDATGASFERMRFVTPLSMRHGQDVQDDPKAVLHGVLRRISGILAWSGIGLPEPHEVLQEHLGDRFPNADWDSKRDADWLHRSQRQGKQFQDRGVLGVFNLGGAPGALWPMFKLAEITHVGAKASIGCGRFEMLQ